MPAGSLFDRKRPSSSMEATHCAFKGRVAGDVIAMPEVDATPPSLPCLAAEARDVGDTARAAVVWLSGAAEAAGEYEWGAVAATSLPALPAMCALTLRNASLAVVDAAAVPAVLGSLSRLRFPFGEEPDRHCSKASSMDRSDRAPGPIWEDNDSRAAAAAGLSLAIPGQARR